MAFRCIISWLSLCRMPFGIKPLRDFPETFTVDLFLEQADLKKRLAF